MAIEDLDPLREEFSRRAGPAMATLRLESTADGLYVVQAEVWAQDRARCFGGGHGEGGSLQEAGELAELDALQRALAYVSAADGERPASADSRAQAPSALPAAQSATRPAGSRLAPTRTGAAPSASVDAVVEGPVSPTVQAPPLAVAESVPQPVTPASLPTGLVSAASGTETCSIPGCGQRLSPIMANASRKRFGEVLCSAHVREKTAVEPTAR